MVDRDLVGKEFVQHNLLKSLQMVRQNLQTQQNTKQGKDLCHFRAPTCSHCCSSPLCRLETRHCSSITSFLWAIDPGFTSSQLPSLFQGRETVFLGRDPKHENSISVHTFQLAYLGTRATPYASFKVYYLLQFSLH